MSIDINKVGETFIYDFSLYGIKILYKKLNGEFLNFIKNKRWVSVINKNWKNLEEHKKMNFIFVMNKLTIKKDMWNFYSYYLNSSIENLQKEGFDEIINTLEDMKTLNKINIELLKNVFKNLLKFTPTIKWKEAMKNYRQESIAKLQALGFININNNRSLLFKDKGGVALNIDEVNLSLTLKGFKLSCLAFENELSHFENLNINLNDIDKELRPKSLEKKSIKNINNKNLEFFYLKIIVVFLSIQDEKSFYDLHNLLIHISKIIKKSTILNKDLSVVYSVFNSLKSTLLTIFPISSR